MLKNEQRFNMLMVHNVNNFILKNNGKNKQRKYYECICDCGNITYACKKDLANGHKKSCGCLKKVGPKPIHNDTNKPFYKTWCHLKERCNNKNCKAYPNYGGREIVHDPRWEKYENFKKDMSFKYIYAQLKYKNKITKRNPLSIERIDVNGNYCKENCIFIPRGNQNKNKRNNKKFKAISPEGKEYISNNQAEFARQFNLKDKQISKCLLKQNKIHFGWFFEYIKEGDK